MEQILTTAALILGGIFAAWILFSDTLGEDGKGGQMDTSLLAAFLMIPIIILILIGIVLFLPILLGIILVIALAYGAYLGLKWILTREREEKEEKLGDEEGRLQKMFRKIRESFSRAWNSQASRAVRERTKKATVTIRKTVKEKGGRLKTRVSERVREVREKGPKKIRESARIRTQSDDEDGVRERVKKVYRKGKERIAVIRDSIEERVSGRRSDSMRGTSETFVETDDRDTHYSDAVIERSRSDRKRTDERRAMNADRNDKQRGANHSYRSDRKSTEADFAESDQQMKEERAPTFRGRLQQKWHSARAKSSEKKRMNDPAYISDMQSAEAKSGKTKKAKASERPHTHDPMSNMRRIGWSTRRHLREVYHHRRRK